MLFLHLRFYDAGRSGNDPCGETSVRGGDKEGRSFVAHTPELDVSSCGGTKEKAAKNLKEAVRPRERYLQRAGCDDHVSPITGSAPQESAHYRSGLASDERGNAYCCSVVGMDVNADAPKRRPNTETFPVETVNSAEPLDPAMPANPRKPRMAFSILLPAARPCVEVPMMFPLLSDTVIVTVVATLLGLTMATLVVKLPVSSQVSVLAVAL